MAESYGRVNLGANTTVVFLQAREPLVKAESITREVRDLGEKCPGVLRWVRLFSCLPTVGKLFFRTTFATYEGLAWLWKERLLGNHRWIPCISSPKNHGLGFMDPYSLVRTVFLEHINSLRNCDAVQRCSSEIENVEEELQQVQKLLMQKNSVSIFQRLVARKNDLLSQKEVLCRKLNEFEEALMCLEMQVNGDTDHFRNFRSADERPVFVLGGTWSWEQLHNILMRECSRLESSLPIYSSRCKIIDAIHLNQVMVLIGETGSGKSTQLVQYLADAGFGMEGSLVCTQPRKMAALALSQRVSEESKGCYSKKNAVMCNTSYVPQEHILKTINFLTDHVLLQICMSTTKLSHISCIIVDEAHERSLSTDLLLAMLKTILVKRHTLRLIIMSATADANSLSRYFNGCQILHVEGRHFPVEINYLGTDHADAVNNSVPKAWHLVIPSYVTHALKVAADIHKKEEKGAILVFLTSQAEVEWAREQFEMPGAVAYALHGKLSIEEQVRVFENAPPGMRKVVFATNIAETSLTIPGIKFVVDSGMSKESKYDPKNGMSVLKVSHISKSAAIQRSGRAGRTGSGICYRLYTQENFESMPCHRDPEILRVHLGIAILKLLALGFKNIQSFDFVQVPSPEAIEVALKNLFQLGALEKDSKGDPELTEFGSNLVKLGVEPRLGKIILDSYSEGLGREGLVLAILMANSSSIFCRVGTDAEKSVSDRLKLRFCQSDGDLFTFLSVYKEWESEPLCRRNRWCWKNSINAKTMARCRDAIQDMEVCLKHELKITIPVSWKWSPNDSSENAIILKRIIFSSMVENLAMFSGYERLGYDIAATRQQAFLHPSCSLLALGQKPRWVVFGELLCTTKQYLTCVTVIQKEWVLEAQPSLSYDTTQLDKMAVQKKVFCNLGSLLLKRFSGKAHCNLHALISELQRAVNTQRFGIETDHEKQEVHLFSLAENMDRLSELVQDVLDSERKWIQDECIEKQLFFTSHRKEAPFALIGSGAEIKHLELNGKYVTVEVKHPYANSLDHREVLLMFEKCAGSIAGFHKISGGADSEQETGVWGTVTFMSPEAAEIAVCKLDNAYLAGSCMSVSPLTASRCIDSKAPAFPAVRATLMWPRRLSKGFAIVNCAIEDVSRIALSCSGKLIGRSCVKCKPGKNPGSVFVYGLDVEVTEDQLVQTLKCFTNRVILDAFIGRHPASPQPPNSVIEAAILQEFAKFVSRGNCRVIVSNSEAKDFYTRAHVTFDGSIHLRAARALSSLEGQILPNCLPWQKIKCQQTFYSTLLIAYSIFSVIEAELRSLIDSLRRENLDVHFYETMTEFKSYKVRISSNKMESVARCRSLLEQLSKGTIIVDDRLDPETIQILYSREGHQLLKSWEKSTKTCIMFEKRSLSVKVFGPANKTEEAVKGVVDGLIMLYENRYQEIRLRGESLPHGLMKELVNKFGVDLAGLEERLPNANFIIDTRRHLLRVRGCREMKVKAGNIVLEIANDMKGVRDKEADEAYGREEQCPICFCGIENCFKLEACGHAFCRSCLIEQCNSAMRHHDGFPLACAHENCSSLLLITDLKLLLSDDQLDELFRASLGAFVASSKGTYRFCTTPDCPSVYEVSTSGRLFVCGHCAAELCTTCHLEYHPYLSCEKYSEFKQDPDASLKEWCRGKEAVKWCPSCGFTIEKIDGCNHVVCKCGKHICWVCLEGFDDSDSCYTHLHTDHGSIN